LKEGKMPTLKSGQHYKWFTQKGNQILDDLHLTIEREEKNNWHVVAHYVVKAKNVDSELSSMPKPYQEALSDALRAAKYYNIPLIKYVAPIKFQILWAPSSSSISTQKRARRELIKDRFGDKKRKK
jgi:hypothetical protein